MRRVYVAGPISPTQIGGAGALEFLKNINRGIEMSARVLLAGFAPFSPFTDFLYFIRMDIPPTPENVDKIRGASLEWLRVSDAVLALWPFENSQGTKDEIREARLRGIPVFFSLPLMNLYFTLMDE